MQQGDRIAGCFIFSLESLGSDGKPICDEWRAGLGLGVCPSPRMSTVVQVSAGRDVCKTRLMRRLVSICCFGGLAEWSSCITLLIVQVIILIITRTTHYLHGGTRGIDKITYHSAVGVGRPARPASDPSATNLVTLSLVQSM